MNAAGWLSQWHADVAGGDAWLGENERLALARLRVGPRRDSWRLGRWTAKGALSEWLALAPREIEVLAAEDGAPEAWAGGERLPVSLSISHRAGRAIAAVTGESHRLGCDLEFVEPRSPAFLREWLAAPEQDLVRSHPAGDSVIANLVWSAKEAAAKVRREGLRLDVRRAVVTVDVADIGESRWRALSVQWPDQATPTEGWWRTEGEWVMTIAAEPATGPPIAMRMTRASCPCLPTRRPARAGSGWLETAPFTR
jgi:4'-phosphopantetheinyl transferase